MKRFQILEFPSNLGLKEPEPGKEPGVKKMPDWLSKHGFHDRINPKKVDTIDPPAYSGKRDEETGVINVDKIVTYARRQAKSLKNALFDSAFPIVLGGDCSILVGNALALKQLGKYGLFFLDGHTDYMLPEQSQTGGVAGMDLAIVTGNGPDKLTGISGLKPYFDESNVWCVGNRHLDETYVESIGNSGINYLDLEGLRGTGIQESVKGFLDMVEEKELDGFFVHFDVDVLDDNIMPAVDSRQKGGLTYEELDVILHGLLKSNKAVGMEITILDPDLDPKGKFTKAFVNNVAKTIRQAQKDNEK